MSRMKEMTMTDDMLVLYRACVEAEDLVAIAEMMPAFQEVGSDAWVALDRTKEALAEVTAMVPPRVDPPIGPPMFSYPDQDGEVVRYGTGG